MALAADETAADEEAGDLAPADIEGPEEPATGDETADGVALFFFVFNFPGFGLMVIFSISLLFNGAKVQSYT